MADSVAGDDPAQVAAELDAEIANLQRLLGDVASLLLGEENRAARRKRDEASYLACRKARMAVQQAQASGRQLRPTTSKPVDLPTGIRHHLDTFSDDFILALAAIDGIGDVTAAVALLGEDAYNRLSVTVTAFRRWRVQAAWIEASRSPVTSAGAAHESGPAATSTTPPAEATLGGLATIATSLTGQLRAAGAHLQALSDALSFIASRRIDEAIHQTLEVRRIAELAADRVARQAHAASDGATVERALQTLRSVKDDARRLPYLVEDYRTALDALASRVQHVRALVADVGGNRVADLYSDSARYFEHQSRAQVALLTTSAHSVRTVMTAIVEQLATLVDR